MGAATSLQEGPVSRTGGGPEPSQALAAVKPRGGSSPEEAQAQVSRGKCPPDMPVPAVGPADGKELVGARALSPDSPPRLVPTGGPVTHLRLQLILNGRHSEENPCQQNTSTATQTDRKGCGGKTFS